MGALWKRIEEMRFTQPMEGEKREVISWWTPCERERGGGGEVCLPLKELPS